MDPMIRHTKSPLSYCILICFGLLLGSSRTGGQCPVSSRIDVTHYAFHIRVTDTSDTIQGEADIKLKLLQPAKYVHLNLSGVRDDGKGMFVTKAGLRQDSGRWKQSNDSLEVIFRRTLPAGTLVDMHIEYKGIPFDGLIISKNRFGQRTFFADNWPQRARCWIPCHDHPSDKATVEFTVDAPLHYSIVSNGLLLGDSLTPAGHSVHWKENVPVSTKVMVIGAADFSVENQVSPGGIPVQLWVYRQNAEAGFRDYSPAAEIVDFYVKYLGAYPYEKLANVQSTTIYGGMENASCIFYSERSVTGQQTATPLLAHEIAHQWFGNSVTECDWPQLWLSEGFATYLTDIYLEHRYGQEKMKQNLEEERQDVLQWPGTERFAVVTAGVDPRRMLTPVTYEKAGWFLHMLRNNIGDSAFHQTLKQYYATFWDSTACTGDFRNIAEQCSGKNLGDFFEEWLYRPGYPQLELSWKYDPVRKAAVITVHQLQNEIFHFPLEIGIAGSGLKSEILTIENKDSEFTIPVSFVPDHLIADPEIKLLATISLKKEQGK